MIEDTFLSAMLAAGGDRRIAIPRTANTNLYGASPFPREIRAYSASTANDISLAAWQHLRRVISGWPAGASSDPAHYARQLDGLRTRMRESWGLADDVAIVFAPSGTDLEFAALALSRAAGGRSVTNILIGEDEVGSGCVLAAGGRHFAGETAVRPAVARGTSLAGLDDSDVVRLPIRDRTGQALSGGVIAQAIAEAARAAAVRGRQVLTHVVHGSKTGLVLPGLADIDRLRMEFGERLHIVVDACQARSTRADLAAYLARDCMVLLTGSKFMGGPPFSGFALAPPALRPHRPLAAGLAEVFRRAEWPGDWRFAAPPDDSANPGLLLRIEAAQFELERYARVSPAARERVIAAFGAAVRGLADRLGVGLVAPSLAGPALHEATLATIDLTDLPSRPDFALAQRWHRVLAARGLRLGQPVKCVRLPQGDWGGTLRLSLSMPLVCELAALDADRLTARLADDMARIADVLEAAQRPVVA